MLIFADYEAVWRDFYYFEDNYRNDDVLIFGKCTFFTFFL